MSNNNEKLVITNRVEIKLTVDMDLMNIKRTSIKML